MGLGGNSTAGRAEDFDAGSGGGDRLGEDQRDRGGRGVEDGIRPWIRPDQLSVGENGLGDEGGDDRENGDRQPPREPQE